MRLGQVTLRPPSALRSKPPASNSLIKTKNCGPTRNKPTSLAFAVRRPAPEVLDSVLGMLTTEAVQWEEIDETQ